MSTKPTDIPTWSTDGGTDGVSGQANNLEPPTSKQASGWHYLEKIPRNWLNWWMNKVGSWAQYLSDGSFDGNVTLTDGNLTLTAGSETITAGDITLTAGDVNLTAGDANITAGDVVLTAGDVDLVAGHVTHGNYEILLSHANGQPSTWGGATDWQTNGSAWLQQGASSKSLYFDIAGLKVGDTIQKVAFWCAGDTGDELDINMIANGAIYDSVTSTFSGTTAELLELDMTATPLTLATPSGSAKGYTIGITTQGDVTPSYYYVYGGVITVSRS